MNTIRAALDARRNDLETRYAIHVRCTFASLVRQFGETFRGVYNSNNASTFSSLVKPNLSMGVTNRPGEVLALDEARISMNAAAYATFIIKIWEAKIVQKMGELESAEARFVSDWSFLIKGKAAGHSVIIEQKMIVNFSAKGTPFNQFPARIYADGKPISAAAWKKMNEVAA